MTTWHSMAFCCGVGRTWTTYVGIPRRILHVNGTCAIYAPGNTAVDIPIGHEFMGIIWHNPAQKSANGGSPFKVAYSAPSRWHVKVEQLPLAKVDLPHLFKAVWWFK
jgi:hypothetical protein